MSDGATDSASAQRAALTPDEKRAKLRALLERRAAGTRSAPLSAGQERLWALERIEPGNRAYVETGSFRFSATLDLRAVQRALDDILRRHEILRTTIAVEDGQPVQRIAAELPVRLEVEDLRELPVVQHGAALREQLRELVERAFDFERGPLWRTKVVRLGDKQHVVLVAIHHMLCDGFSIRLLLAELFELYAAHRLGQPARLPAPVAQYADFARWQRRWLESDAFTSELDFWRRTLAGPIPVVELPPDRPRGDAPRRFRGARLRFEVPDRVYDALRARATEANATPFVVLIAAFDLLLHAYTGECDIAVATPVAGRDRPEFERVVGFFANSVVLRSDLSGDPTFLALLARVRETVLGALSHQRAPVERVLKELGVASTPGHSRLVRAGIALLPAWTDHLHAPGYDVEVLDLDSGTSRIELALMLWQGASTLSGTVEYDTDLYDASTVERFVDHYVRLLGALVRDPLRRASAGIPLDDGEARALEQRRERWREAHASAPAGAVRSGPAARALSARASPAGELGARASLRAPARRDPDAELEQLCERSNLTRNQLLVWLGQRAQPELPLYNIPVFFHMDVGIDVGPFRRALQGLVDACEVLRTVFDEVEGLPQRRVLPHFEVEVPLHDLSRERDPDAALEAFAEARRGVKFSPSRPMFETALLVLGPRRTVWYFNQHHLIGDGRSAVLLLRALDELYRGARAGADLALELPTFDAFAREERALRGTPRWDAARRHWREALADPPPPLWFHARSLGARSTKVRRITLALGTRRSARLIGAARALGGASEKQALYHAVAAALFAWLHRMSGNRRLAIGSPLANRVGRSHKHTPGLFMQVVPIALEIAADETLRSLARKVARELRGAMRHQRYATANPADRPFYEVGLNVHVARTAPFDGAPLRSDWRHPGHEHELLAVQIRDFDGTGELSLDFDAREDRFDAAEARRGAERLVALLDALIEDPDRRVDALEMPDAAERRQLVDELNRTPSLAAEDPIALFQRAVDRHAARTAVVDGD
ncbi:MAG TPA: condensation domain-containing protein, partial [Myxococcota bacterium]|nr:condensation domain-containing protein [Myxococcota bacterium]